MQRVVIVALDKKFAVGLSPDGSFVRIPGRPAYRIGEEVELSASLSSRPVHWGITERVFKAKSALLLASAASIFLLICALWLFREPPVVAYLTLDVNPSLELGLDNKGRVRELRALNPDAGSIVKSVAYKGKSIETVAAELAGALAEKQYLTPQREIVVTSVALRPVKSGLEQHMTVAVKQALEKAAAGLETQANPQNRPQITSLILPREVRDAAKDQGLSAGKMAFWLKAESQGHHVALANLERVSMDSLARPWGGIRQVLSSSDEGEEDSDQWQALLAQTGEQRQAALAARSLSTEPPPSAHHKSSDIPALSAPPLKTEVQPSVTKRSKTNQLMKSGTWSILNQDKERRLDKRRDRYRNWKAATWRPFDKHGWQRGDLSEFGHSQISSSHKQSQHKGDKQSSQPTKLNEQKNSIKLAVQSNQKSKSQTHTNKQHRQTKEAKQAKQHMQTKQAKQAKQAKVKRTVAYAKQSKYRSWPGYVRHKASGDGKAGRIAVGSSASSNSHKRSK